MHYLLFSGLVVLLISMETVVLVVIDVLGGISTMVELKVVPVGIISLVRVS